MIDKLTQQQIDAMPKYVDLWTKIGLNTVTDRAKAEETLPRVYKEGGLPPPKEIHWVRSPKEAWTLLKKLSPGMTALPPALYGAHDAPWLAFYSFFMIECGLEASKRLLPLMDLAKYCGWVWVSRSVAIMSDLPVELHMRNRVLHKEAGPSIRYGDGYKLYHLHGVTVEPWMAETPVDSLKPGEVLGIRNVEQRAVVILRMGMDRLLGHMKTKVLDEDVVTDGSGVKHPYKLHEIHLDPAKRWVYLEMLNPSTGMKHLEAVSPECTTVKQALKYRSPFDIDIPGVLT